MKILRQFLFTFVAVIGLSLAVSAQKDDKKPPPKEKPPVVEPGKKNPPKENPPKGDKPKKPSSGWLFETSESEE